MDKHQSREKNVINRLKHRNTVNHKDNQLADVAGTVSAVIADIRERGDVAVRAYSEKFDGWSPERFRLDQSQIDRIVEGVPQTVLDDIEAVQHRVRTFAQHQKDSLSDFEVETEPGVFLGQKNLPVSAAGAYVPGGRYPLVASAHMTVVTAKVAGVERVTACMPPLKGRFLLRRSPHCTRRARMRSTYSVAPRRSPRWRSEPRPSARSI